MADSPPCMVSVPEASQKAARRFDRDSRSWAALLFRQEIGQCADGEPVRCSISLHPPTERRVLKQSRCRSSMGAVVACVSLD